MRNKKNRTAKIQKEKSRKKKKENRPKKKKKKSFGKNKTTPPAPPLRARHASSRVGEGGRDWSPISVLDV